MITAALREEIEYLTYYRALSVDPVEIAAAELLTASLERIFASLTEET